MVLNLTRWLFFATLALMALARPVAAQVIEAQSGPISFPVLVSEAYRVDPRTAYAHERFRMAEGALALRSTEGGWIDTEAFCTLPDRHWGPASVVSCTLEVTGRKPETGMTIPARITLAGVPLGGTVTLRVLMQAPIIVLDIDGNPAAVMDTFVEEYQWTLVNRS